MLDVDVCFDDIVISNIQKEDLPNIEKMSEADEEFNFSELNDRFLESYLSECEYFLKINKNKKLIGVIKGRVEFKNSNEVWVWFYYIKEKSLECMVMQELLLYFFQEYDIEIFYTRVAVEDENAVKFWKKLGFRPLRLVKNFYSINGKSMDMLIMENGSVLKNISDISN